MSRQQNSPFTLILLGDPATGKDTQIGLLEKKYSARVFASGNALRALQKKDARVRKTLERTIGKGKLAPTGIYRRLLLENVGKVPRSKNLILNGNPRMLGEARLALKVFKSLGRAVPIVVYLQVPIKEILRRTKLRADTGKRTDDAYVKTRIREHRIHLDQALAYFAEKVPMARVSGLGSIEEVHEKIVAAVEKLRKK